MTNDFASTCRRGRPRVLLDDPHESGPELTVVLVDGRAWTREGFAHALEMACDNLRVITVADVADLAHADVEGEAVVVLNTAGSQWTGHRLLSLVESAHAHLPGLPVVALSDQVATDDILSAVEQGLNGYIPISMEIKLVIDALHFVAAGGTFVPADLLLAGLADGTLTITSSEPAAADGERILLAQNTEAINQLLNALTPRERSVTQVLRQGKSNKHIARELGMSEATVKVHVGHIMRKLRARNRTQIALLADHLP